MSKRKDLDKDLRALKKRINEELASLKETRFHGMTDRDFEAESGVSRASLPGIETGRSWPRLDTIYLWATACGSSLAELFRSPSGEYDEAHREFHRNLEVILKTQGVGCWIALAVRSEYNRIKPPARQVKGNVAPNEKKKPSKASG